MVTICIHGDDGVGIAETYAGKTFRAENTLPLSTAENKRTERSKKKKKQPSLLIGKRCTR